MTRSEGGTDAPLVLVVDDDITVRLLAREALEQAGFSIEEAENGTQAISAFKRLHPEIVLLDVMMPEMDGFAVCAKLRALPEGERTPIILLTGLEDVGSINRAYEVGATDFVSKPFNEIILGHRVRHILKASRTLKKLWTSESRLAHAQRTAHLGNWEWNIARNEFTGSEEFYKIVGLGENTVSTFQDLLQCVDPDDREFVKNSIDEALHGGPSVDIKHRVVLPGGAQRTVHQQYEVVFDEDENPLTVLGTVQDISELKRFEERIHFLAYYDSLTSLPNRVLFRDRLEQAVAYARRHSTNVVTMFIDLDRFKRINDTLGHHAGDTLLRTIAERIRDAVRESDSISRAASETSTMARLGGDEFTVLLTNLSYVQDAAKVAQRTLDCICQPVDLGDQEVTVTASIGISVFPDDGADVDDLLKHADVAMYYAKDQGKNNYRFYSRAMNATAFERLILENDLRKAIEGNEFLVYYQPKVAVGSQEILGVEALVRWRHRDMNLLSPGVFLQVAEEAGLIDAIDLWVLREACVQFAIWRAEGCRPITISVNVSNNLFRRDDLLPTIERVLDECNMDPRHIELELTERIIMNDVDSVIQKTQALKSLGLKLSIDDFGTGYSSLSHLRRLSLDTLKIDRVFVREIPENEDDVAITRAIIAMAHNLKLSVTAEGVETPEQLRFLEEHGCDEIQGYLFSRARGADEISEMLKGDKVLQPDPPPGPPDAQSPEKSLESHL